MLKKGKQKRGCPRKRKATVETTAMPSWKTGVENNVETKITLYFQLQRTHPNDHTYSKGNSNYLSDIKIESGENGEVLPLRLPNAAKKKLNGTGALTACNAQNTKTVVNGAMHGKSSVKSEVLSEEKTVQKEMRNKQLTDYFPVRRSVRKTSVAIKKEKQKEMEDRILSGSEDGYEARDFNGKGRGVVSVHPIKRGDFVLEYSGDLISVEEAKRREFIYSHDENIGCYMYYFTHKNRQYCVDATRETGRLGRLVNHSKKGNLKTKSVSIQDIPRLILIAERDIFPGEELLYDYGDRSKRSLESHPWLAL